MHDDGDISTVLLFPTTTDKAHTQSRIDAFLFRTSRGFISLTYLYCNLEEEEKFTVT